jgi:hypothetical protein
MIGNCATSDRKIGRCGSSDRRRPKNGRRGQKDKGGKKRAKKIFYMFTPAVCLQFQNGADTYRNKPVILLVQVGTGARPAPVFNRLAEPRPQRVALDVTDRFQQILLVHDEGVEAFLPKVSAPSLTEIDHPGVAAVCLGNRTAQSVLFARRHDEVHVVRHRAIGPNLRPAAIARGRHEVLVLREVLVREKHLLATIATLRDVMRKTGGYDACDSVHRVHRHHEDEISILSPEMKMTKEWKRSCHRCRRHP